MAREDNDRKQQSHNDEAREQNRGAETDQPDPGERSAETAKDINVVRGDDRPQAVRHAG